MKVNMGQHMKTRDRDLTKHLKALCAAKQTAVKQRLDDGLQNLEHNIKYARLAIEASKPVDGHLITNAAYITAEIERWNMLLEMLPFFDEG